MKVILSRKGFDSGSGGHPSPILPDGKLLSLPVPRDGRIKYSEIYADGNKTYYEVMQHLYKDKKIKLKKEKFELTQETTCHLDPDLKRNTRKRLPGWNPLFGQHGGDLTHLFNYGVDKGDIFLFFGLFKKTHDVGDSLEFIRGEKKIHCIWGYLEVGDFHDVNNPKRRPKWMDYHPHLHPPMVSDEHNCIFEAIKNLSFNKRLKGAGVFKYSDSLVLTKPGLSTSKWQLPEFFKDVNVSYHTNSEKYGWKGDHFQSAARGQEFVIEENPKVTNWAKEIIEGNTTEL